MKASATCRSCGAGIVWVQMASGKANPLDPEPVADGNVIITDADDWHTATGLHARMLKRGEPMDEPETARYRSHFVTCPHAAQHRKKATP